jgi:excisionase family DNA binding protein
MLRIPKSWLYGRIHAGTLPFPMTKIGHYVRFPESGIRAYLEVATTKPRNGGNGAPTNGQE